MFGNDRGRDRYDIIRALSRAKNSFANDTAIESAPAHLGNAGYFAGSVKSLLQIWFSRCSLLAHTPMRKKSSPVGRDSNLNGRSKTGTEVPKPCQQLFPPTLSCASNEIDKNLTITDWVVLGISVFRHKRTTWTQPTSTKVTLTTTRHSY
jgi:hypothetical protein